VAQEILDAEELAKRELRVGVPKPELGNQGHQELEEALEAGLHGLMPRPYCADFDVVLTKFEGKAGLFRGGGAKLGQAWAVAQGWP
jgi:hypothetical protein